MSWIKEQFSFNDLQRLLMRLSQHVKVFQGMTPAEISDLLGDSEKCSFAPGAYIIKEGNGGSHMYIMLSGEAKVMKGGRDGDIELAVLKAADSFGEMALADNEQRSASVVAKTPCVLVRIGTKTINTRPEIGLKVYQNLTKVLAARLRVADEKLVLQI